MGLAQDIADRGGADVEVLYGTIAAVISGTTVSVYVGGNLHTGKLLAAPGYLAMVGDPVVVLRQGQRLTVLGAVSPPLPATGVVTAVPGITATTITVTVDGVGSLNLPYLAGYSPTVTDQVAILWRGGAQSGLVLDEVGNALKLPPPPPPPPAPPPAPITGATTFTAVDVGSHRDGEWRTDANGDVIQGTFAPFGANVGVWFYGGQPKATLAGVTVTAAEIWLGRTAGGTFGSQNCHLYRVTDDYRGGAPTFGAGPYDIGLTVGQEAWFPMSTSIAQAIVTSGGSVGISGSPYMRMYGLLKSGQAGSIRIYWRR